MSKGSSKVLAGEKSINQKHPVEAQVTELLQAAVRTMSGDELLGSWLDSWMVMHGWLCPWIGRAGQVGHKKIGLSRARKTTCRWTDGQIGKQIDRQKLTDGETDIWMHGLTRRQIINKGCTNKKSKCRVTQESATIQPTSR